ncbi:hypothetical protein LTR37_011874 [Vermiconidia calcicola]|uniref:Uncharacterized protein n=1 Tax=Vermiconidia calcicola TaxID=1690605 RepID=A0ACC3N187_9PEZI|nr:hypothetical protein LTR37_011874 [Vermiconidia calcicola]
MTSNTHSTRTTRRTSRHFDRSRSLPTTTPVGPSLLRTQTSPAELASPSDANDKTDVAATILAQDEEIRTRFRQHFFDQKQYVHVEQPFEEIFDCPADENLTAEPARAARDLEECCRLFAPGGSSDMTQMGRFLTVAPHSEQTFVDSRSRVATLGIKQYSVADSARLRVQTAVSLSADASETAVQRRPEVLPSAAAQSRPPRRPRRNARHGQSWLDLDDSADDR